MMGIQIVSYIWFFIGTSVPLVMGKPNPVREVTHPRQSLNPREHTAHMIEELATVHHAFSIPSARPRPAHALGSRPDPIAELLSENVPGSKPDGAWAKIIGGTPAPQDRWPWSVALDTEEYGFICSGTLIGRQWVLAAAHCTAGAPTVYARIGAWNLTVNDEIDIVRVESIIVHPMYGVNEHSQQTMNPYDIALLRLVRLANVSDSDILSLPDMMFNLFTLNPFCFVIGWGRTDLESPETSEVLTEMSVNVITAVECQLRWNEAFSQPRIYLTQLCIDEGIYGNTSACQGDSGSPLQCYDVQDGRWKLAGFASWGSEACHTFPSVYIRVQYFLEWIYSVVAANPAQ